MRLTKAEFCIFNTKSKLKLLKKDGKLLRQRRARDNIVFSIYSIYQFHIETILDVAEMKTVSVNPIMNEDVLTLYPP